MKSRHTRNLNQTTKFIKEEWKKAQKVINEQLESLAGQKSELSKKFEEQMKSTEKEKLRYRDDNALLEYQKKVSQALMGFFRSTASGFLKFEAELKSNLSTEPHYSHCYGLYRVYREIDILTSYYNSYVQQDLPILTTATNISAFAVILTTKFNINVALTFNGAMPHNRAALKEKVGTEVADLLDQIASNSVTVYKGINDFQIREFLEKKAIPADVTSVAEQEAQRIEEERNAIKADRRAKGLPEDSD